MNEITTKYRKLVFKFLDHKFKDKIYDNPPVLDLDFVVNGTELGELCASDKDIITYQGYEDIITEVFGEDVRGMFLEWCKSRFCDCRLGMGSFTLYTRCNHFTIIYHYNDNELHTPTTTDLPAIVVAYGSFRKYIWVKNNKVHRENGPALILADVNDKDYDFKYHYLEGKMVLNKRYESTLRKYKRKVWFHKLITKLFGKWKWKT